MTHPLQLLRHPIAAPPRPIARWRLWLPLLLQTALIVAVPAKDAYTVAAGRTVILQTVPVDPYDPLRGYSQTLRYDISSVESLKSLPGGTWFDQQYGRGSHVFVIMEAPQDSGERIPWRPVQISGDRPTDLAENQIALQGYYDGIGQIQYGLETYYMPEADRQQVNTAISNQRQSPENFVVETKVDGTGNAVVISLWVESQNYRF